MDNFIFHHQNLTSYDSRLVINAFNKAKSKVSMFFGTPPPDTEIIIARDFDHMCELIGKKRPVWGETTNKDGKIYLSDPLSWKKEITGHTLEDLKSSLAHQLVHLHFQRNSISLPIWFEEGIAVFVGRDSGIKNREKDFKNLTRQHKIPNLQKNPSTFSSHPIPALAYLTSYKFICFLIAKSGKEKLVNFINSFSKYKNFDEALSSFWRFKSKSYWNTFEKSII